MKNKHHINQQYHDYHQLPIDREARPKRTCGRSGGQRLSGTDGIVMLSTRGLEEILMHAGQTGVHIACFVSLFGLSRIVSFVNMGVGSNRSGLRCFFFFLTKQIDVHHMHAQIIRTRPAVRS